MIKNSVEYKRFVWELNNVININNTNKNIIFLCIGTNNVVGDSFGPAVGTSLKKHFSKNDNIKIIGELENTITYSKIEENITNIKRKYKDSLIIVLDSALSNKQNIGKVFIQNRGLKYAEALKKHNHIIGNMCIKAVVGENANNSMSNFKILNEVSMEKIQLMSNMVSKGIIEVMNKKENNGKNIYK